MAYTFYGEINNYYYMYIEKDKKKKKEDKHVNKVK